MDSDAVPTRSEDRQVVGDVYRQVGEALATARGIGHEVVDLKRSLREDLGEIKRSIAAIQHSQVAAQHDREKQINRIAELERLGSERHAANTRRLDQVASDIADLKRPVSEFVSMKKRASSFVMVAVAISGVLWTLAEPLYRFLLLRVFHLPSD